MRIMMIGPYPSSPYRINGGVAAAMMYLSEALSASAEIDLLGVRIQASAGSASNNKSFAWPMADLPLGRLSLSTFYRVQARELQKIIRSYKPHIVHAQGTDVAGHLAVRCGIPSVVTVHGILAECAKFETDLTSRLRATLTAEFTERRTIRRASDLIAISPYVSQYYESEINGRVHFVPNPVSSAFFGVVRRPERGRFLYAGRIANGKGILELLRAFARGEVKDASLVLSGATPDPEYERLLRGEVQRLELGDKVFFTGLLDERSLVREFARADALVLPSFQETAPMVIQEAMAAGLPVIATRIGGVPDQIDHETTGFLFEPGDIARLGELMGHVVQSREAVRRVGDAAKTMAGVRYKADKVAESTISVYEHMLNVASTPPSPGLP